MSVSTEAVRQKENASHLLSTGLQRQPPNGETQCFAIAGGASSRLRSGIAVRKTLGISAASFLAAVCAPWVKFSRNERVLGTMWPQTPKSLTASPTKTARALVRGAGSRGQAWSGRRDGGSWDNPRRWSLRLHRANARLRSIGG